MIFLFALNHQRTRQNLLGKGNQFLCQQRNPRVSSPFRVASKANRERTREWGPRQSRERLSSLGHSESLSRLFRFACYSRVTSYDIPRREEQSSACLQVSSTVNMQVFHVRFIFNY